MQAEEYILHLICDATSGDAEQLMTQANTKNRFLYIGFQYGSNTFHRCFALARIAWSIAKEQAVVRGIV